MDWFFAARHPSSTRFSQVRHCRRERSARRLLSPLLPQPLVRPRERLRALLPRRLPRRRLRPRLRRLRRPRTPTRRLRGPRRGHRRGLPLPRGGVLTRGKRRRRPRAPRRRRSRRPRRLRPRLRRLPAESPPRPTGAPSPPSRAPQEPRPPANATVPQLRDQIVHRVPARLGSIPAVYRASADVDGSVGPRERRRRIPSLEPTPAAKCHCSIVTNVSSDGTTGSRYPRAQAYPTPTDAALSSGLAPNMAKNTRRRVRGSAW